MEDTLMYQSDVIAVLCVLSQNTRHEPSAIGEKYGSSKTIEPIHG
jgi:hypothetical protein